MSITIKIETFEGPLDLLLHLIEKNKMSIYDIQIAPITNQYMAYIGELEKTQKVPLENISDFIVMAATLLLIKSKMLLPKPEKEDPEEDPREELVARLLAYKKMKHISSRLKEYERDAEKVFYRNSPIHLDQYRPAPLTASEALEEVSMEQIYETFKELIKRQDFKKIHSSTIEDVILKQDSYTVTEKSKYILDLIAIKETIVFHTIFDKQTTKMEMIVTFMALLELVHKRKIKIYQEKLLEDIWISGVRKHGRTKD